MQDIKFKRQAIARNYTILCRNLVVTILALKDMKDEITQLGIDEFVQTDFDDVQDLSHLTPSMLGYLKDEVIPHFVDEYENGQYNKEILNKVRAS